jgi:hypothetical protein
MRNNVKKYIYFVIVILFSSCASNTKTYVDRTIYGWSNKQEVGVIVSLTEVVTKLEKDKEPKYTKSYIYDMSMHGVPGLIGGYYSVDKIIFHFKNEEDTMNNLHIEGDFVMREQDYAVISEREEKLPDEDLRKINFITKNKIICIRNFIFY